MNNLVEISQHMMQVYLPAVAPFIPPKMVRTMSAFLDFCYLARREFHTEDTLRDMKNHLDQFHEHREIFVETGVRDHFNPPRQHSLRHYLEFVQEFGSLNGLCSSITESAHIRAVKRPWRRSSRFHALGQMLLTNQRLDKLQAARSDFEERGMLDVPLIQTIEESLRVCPPRNTAETKNPVSMSDSEDDTTQSGDDSGEEGTDTELENPISSATVLAKCPSE